MTGSGCEESLVVEGDGSSGVEGEGSLVGLEGGGSVGVEGGGSSAVEGEGLLGVKGALGSVSCAPAPAHMAVESPVRCRVLVEFNSAQVLQSTVGCAKRNSRTGRVNIACKRS